MKLYCNREESIFLRCSLFFDAKLYENVFLTENHFIWHALSNNTFVIQTNLSSMEYLLFVSNARCLNA